MSRVARGRPLRPVRPTPRRPGWYGCEDRVAWLLRVNRLYGDDERLAGVAGFAAAFRGGCRSAPVSASQISRWETAAARAGFGVLRRYEELLGLAPHRLVAVADWAYRKASAEIGPPVLGRGLDPADPQVLDRTERLLEQALSADLMTSADWDELTGYLVVLPTAFLYPRSAWADLAERLLAELLIADGFAWLSRIEALSRLMADPRVRPAIIAACGSLAADPASQVIIEPLTILDMTADYDANRHVLAQLADPASDRAMRGALLSSLEKIRRRHFRPPQLRSLAVAAADMLSVTSLHTEARNVAAELLRHAPAGQVGPAYERLRGSTDPTTRSILTYGQTALPRTAGQVVARVAATAVAQLPASAGADPDSDPMLSLLLGELLFGPNQNERLLAGLLLAATPYRDPVGAALATELATAPAAGMVPLTTAILTAMPFVGRPADRPIVERLVLAAGPVAPITDTATWIIGHIRGHSDQRFWLTAVGTHSRAWQRTRSPDSMSSLRGLIYALGIGRHHDLLRVLRADTHLPASARAAAGWWLNIPTRIHASAAR